MSTSSPKEPPNKRFKANHHPTTDDVLAHIDSKTKQIDELLAGFDNPKNSLNFIPSSLNKSSSSTNSKSSSSINTSNDQFTKTITITATSFKIEHHPVNDTQNTANHPIPIPLNPLNHHIPAQTRPQPIQLRPLPSPNAKPIKSALKKCTFTSFRDEKRNKRRSKSKDNSDETHEIRKKSISFNKSVKKEDGESAKFYSAPQYLIRDGTTLRPKPREQIQNEKRLLQMLGAPEELAGRALPPGLLDEDWDEVYDPQIPNDYSSFVSARHRLEEWIQMRKEQRNIAYQKAMTAAQYAQEYIDTEIKREKEHEKTLKRNKERERSHRYKHRKREHRDRDRDRDRRSRRDRSRSRERDYHRRSSRNKSNKEYGFMGVLPTESPLEAMHHNYDDGDKVDNSHEQRLSGIDKAAKMMAKFGWKRGDGLGKSKQGLKGCLVPVGGYNQLMSVQDPTNILLLQNMAGKGEVDVHLKTETVEECKQFGPVLDCVVHETNKRNVSSEQQVSVFVKFEYIESCMNALQRFNGRFFDGRRVVAAFFPTERFDAKDLDP